MEEQDIDLWVMITREYNEDPIVKTLLPPTWLNARRRTILVFSKTNDGIDPVAITRYNFGKNIFSCGFSTKPASVLTCNQKSGSKSIEIS